MCSDETEAPTATMSHVLESVRAQQGQSRFPVRLQKPMDPGISETENTLSHSVLKWEITGELTVFVKTQSVLSENSGQGIISYLASFEISSLNN